MPTKKKKRGKKKGTKTKQEGEPKVVCYHGSSKKGFEGVYEDAVDDYFRCIQTSRADPEDVEAMSQLSENFVQAQPRLTFDPLFCSHLFAWAAREYFKSHLSKSFHQSKVATVLSLATMLRYHYHPKFRGEDVGQNSTNFVTFSKYNRDIYTKRGIVNYLAKEVPCECFRAEKAEMRRAASGEDKMAYCFGCKKEVPKKILKVCSRCEDVKYCGQECQKNHWPEHKIVCKKKQSVLKNQECVEVPTGIPSKFLRALRSFDHPRLVAATDDVLRVGDLVKIDVNAVGKNASSRGIIVTDDPRKNESGPTFCVIVEGSAQRKQRTRSSLSKIPPRSLPEQDDANRGMLRGAIDDFGLRSRILVEYLVCKTSSYVPSEIIFMGEAASHFMMLPNYPNAYGNLTCLEMEQFGGLLALARLAEEHPCEVVFALAEADPMVVDVVIMLLTCTPCIGGQDGESEGFANPNPFQDLTPPQDSPEYIHTIQYGHLRLLTNLLFGAFWTPTRALLRRSPIFHLLVRRLLWIISRDTFFRDGTALAHHCKGILDHVVELGLDSRANDVLFTQSAVAAKVAKRALDSIKAPKKCDDIEPVLQNVFKSLCN